MTARAEIVAHLLGEMTEYYEPFEYYPLYLLTWHLRGVAPSRSTAEWHSIAREALDAFRSTHRSRVVWTHWPIDSERAWPTDPGTPLDFDLDPEGPLDEPLQVLVPDRP